MSVPKMGTDFFFLLDLRKCKNDSMESKCRYIGFIIATLFNAPYRQVKRHGNFKTNIPIDSTESFLYCHSSRLKRVITLDYTKYRSCQKL